MKSIKLTLVAVVLSGTLGACNRPEPAAAAAPPEPAAAQPAPEVAVPPPASEPVPAPVPADAAPGDDTGETEDLPHSGGDKVGTKPSPATGG